MTTVHFQPAATGAPEQVRGNYTQVKKAERAAWRTLKVFNALAKKDAAFKADAETANDLWLKYYNREKALNLAAAERDEQLYTVFIPDRNGVREVVRTPKYKLEYRHWNNLSGTGTCPRSHGSAFRVSAWDNPWREFADLQRVKVVA